MRMIRNIVVGALALLAVASAGAGASARAAPPELIKVSFDQATAAGTAGITSCDRRFRRGYRSYGYGFRRHYGYRPYRWRRPSYGYRRPFYRPYGYRRPFYGPVYGFRPHYGYRRPYGWHNRYNRRFY